MALVVPKERKQLSADARLRLVRSGFNTLPHQRSLDAESSLTDALMSAFARFSLQAPSLLAFDQQRAEGKLQTIYGITCVPCDTRMREIRDPVSPTLLRPLFKSVFRQFQRGKAREPMAFLEDSSGVALDGTGYFSSKTRHCASCLHKVHRNGSRTYDHQMVGAAILQPDLREVMPLMPAPIVKQDGTATNECERNAAKRFLVKRRQDHPPLKVIITADSLSAHAPPHRDPAHARSARHPRCQRGRAYLSVPARPGGGVQRTRDLV
jgi:hypothetical protein